MEIKGSLLVRLLIKIVWFVLTHPRINAFSFRKNLFFFLFSEILMLVMFIVQPGLLLKGWLVGCFGFNGPLRQYFSLYRAVSQREGEKEEKG